jgi:hypothetical protein
LGELAELTIPESLEKIDFYFWDYGWKIVGTLLEHYLILVMILRLEMMKEVNVVMLFWVVKSCQLEHASVFRNWATKELFN